MKECKGCGKSINTKIPICNNCKNKLSKGARTFLGIVVITGAKILFDRDNIHKS